MYDRIPLLLSRHTAYNLPLHAIKKSKMIVSPEEKKLIDAEIKFCVSSKQKALANISDEISVLELTLPLEEKLNSTENAILKNLYSDFLSSIYNELGSQLNIVEYLEMSKAYYESTDYSLVGFEEIIEAKFRYGRSFFYQYKTQKTFCSKNNLHFDKYHFAKKYLFEAHNILQNVFHQGVLTNRIKGKRYLISYIANELAHISIELCRWVEFQYYLSFIPDDEIDHQSFILRLAGIDAFIKNTHTDQYSSIANGIVKNGLKALSYSEITDRQTNSVLAVLKEYTVAFGTEIKNKEDLDKYVENEKIEDHSANIKARNSYQEWISENNLALNEHSLYCLCNLSDEDDLSLETSHAHTKHEWLYNFQLLIEHVKIDFTEARLLFYESLNKMDLEESNNFKKVIEEDNVLLTRKSRLLISSFKQTYSILDRIAVAMVSVFNAAKDKPIYFHDFIDYFKKKIDISTKTYLIAIESIANELYHANENAVFKDYKIWRDAIEHNYLFLIKSDSNKEEIEQKYDNLERVTFINEDEMINRLMLLQHLCRSSIFSLVFLIRDECCNKYFDHK